MKKFHVFLYVASIVVAVFLGMGQVGKVSINSVKEASRVDCLREEGSIECEDFPAFGDGCSGGVSMPKVGKGLRENFDKFSSGYRCIDKNKKPCFFAKIYELTEKGCEE